MLGNHGIEAPVEIGIYVEWKSTDKEKGRAQTNRCKGIPLHRLVWGSLRLPNSIDLSHAILPFELHDEI